MKVLNGIDANSKRITSVGTPSSGSDATTKDYVDTSYGIPAPFYFSGTLAVGTGKARFIVPPGNWTLTSVTGIIVTANTGASVLIDVNKNGTTVFTTQSNRLTIPVSTTSTQTSGTIQVTSLAGGDVLAVDIDQIGSTIAGADLSVQLYLTKAL